MPGADRAAVTGSPLLPWLGQRVTVVVDRPLGSRHPKHPNLVYPINYDYIPNTEAGDGQPIDAYAAGVHVPVERFEGVVIAVVVRRDDVEDKLVVAPAGTRILKAEIERAVLFQERFFASEIVTGSDV